LDILRIFENKLHQFNNGDGYAKYDNSDNKEIHGVPPKPESHGRHQTFPRAH
jgi:hypothetical protein